MRKEETNGQKEGRVPPHSYEVKNKKKEGEEEKIKRTAGFTALHILSGRRDRVPPEPPSGFAPGWVGENVERLRRKVIYGLQLLVHRFETKRKKKKSIKRTQDMTRTFFFVSMPPVLDRV